MAIRIVTDYPRPAGRRLARPVRLVLGTTLLVLGMSTVPAIVVWSVLHRPGSARPSTLHTTDRVVLLILLSCVASTLIGARLIRGRRRLLLFLRRFGYSHATRAITVAALGAFGRSWRVVTLDDASIEPVGATTAAKRASRLSGTVLTWITWPVSIIYGLVIATFWTAAAGTAALAALTAHRHRSVDTLFQAALSGEPVSGDASVLRKLLIAGAAACAAPAFLMVLGLGAYLAMGTTFPVAAAVARGSHAAERSSRAAIATAPQLRTVPHAIAHRSRRLFSPRLVVVAVASELWRQAVTQFASRATLVVVDVSRPTDNLLWELDNVLPTFKARCVLIGVYDEVRRTDDLPTFGNAEDRNRRRLAEMLDGHEILAYTADDAGLKQFARALTIRIDTDRSI